MKWTEKQRRIAEVILAHRADNEHGYEFGVVMKALSGKDPVSRSQVSGVGRELKAKNWEIVEDQGEQTPDNGATPLSTVKVKGAPVRFIIKGEEIALQADHLFSCYFIYLDMKERLELEDSFSEAMVTGMRTIWKLTSKVSVTTEGGKND